MDYSNYYAIFFLLLLLIIVYSNSNNNKDIVGGGDIQVVLDNNKILSNEISIINNQKIKERSIALMVANTRIPSIDISIIYTNKYYIFVFFDFTIGSGKRDYYMLRKDIANNVVSTTLFVDNTPKKEGFRYTQSFIILSVELKEGDILQFIGDSNNRTYYQNPCIIVATASNFQKLINNFVIDKYKYDIKYTIILNIDTDGSINKKTVIMLTKLLNTDLSKLSTNQSNPNVNCVDKNPDCAYWSSIGECKKNPNYMLPNCPKSCNTC